MVQVKIAVRGLSSRAAELVRYLGHHRRHLRWHLEGGNVFVFVITPKVWRNARGWIRDHDLQSAVLEVSWTTAEGEPVPGEPRDLVEQPDLPEGG